MTENINEYLVRRIEELQAIKANLEEEIRSNAQQIIRLEATNKANRKVLSALGGQLAAHKRVLRDSQPPEEERDGAL